MSTDSLTCGSETPPQETQTPTAPLPTSKCPTSAPSPCQVWPEPQSWLCTAVVRGMGQGTRLVLSWLTSQTLASVPQVLLHFLLYLSASPSIPDLCVCLSHLLDSSCWRSCCSLIEEVSSWSEVTCSVWGYDYVTMLVSLCFSDFGDQ